MQNTMTPVKTRTVGDIKVTNESRHGVCITCELFTTKFKY